MGEGALVIQTFRQRHVYCPSVLRFQLLIEEQQEREAFLKVHSWDYTLESRSQSPQITILF